MAINKVIYGNDTLIDLTSDTVDSSNLLSGYTAHDRSGASIVGSAVIPTVNDGTLTIQRNGVNVQTFSANQSTDVTADIAVPTSEEKTTTKGKFTTETGGKLESCIVAFEPIQSGSGDPSPSNVRPITGHSSVEVWEHGKNCFDEYLELGDISGATGAEQPSTNYLRSNFIYVDSSKSYYLRTPTKIRKWTYCYDINKGYLGVSTFISGDTNETFTLPQNCCYIRFALSVSTYGSSTYKNDVCLNVSDASFNGQYVPYQGQDVIVNLGGTYYSGKYVFVSGVLTVDSALETYNGSENWYEHSSGRFYLASLPTGIDISKRTQNNLFKCNTRSYILDQTGYGAYIFYGTGGIYCSKVDADESLASFKSSLNTTNMVVVYPLATPLTIQLTPQQINTLIGENNIDVPLEGQTLGSAVYRELFAWDDVTDVVKAVDDKNADVSAIGTDESGRTTASRSYIQGEHFYKDGKFGKTKTAVAEGATWTLNTNYEETTIADELEVKDVTSEFTFDTDCSWNTDWTKIYKYGKLIKGYARFSTPSTMTSDKKIIIIPAKYQSKSPYCFLCTIVSPWTGQYRGCLGFAGSGQAIRLMATAWATDTAVLATFEYLID